MIKTDCQQQWISRARQSPRLSTSGVCHWISFNLAIALPVSKVLALHVSHPTPILHYRDSAGRCPFGVVVTAAVVDLHIVPLQRWKGVSPCESERRARDQPDGTLFKFPRTEARNIFLRSSFGRYSGKSKYRQQRSIHAVGQQAESDLQVHMRRAHGWDISMISYDICII
ncbi:hypothetical protein QR685DRAFT_469402, partial [Neurospora intermedia]